MQRRDFERRLWSYLAGQWRQGGWWYYYLYGLGVKWPLGTWLLFAIALCSVCLARLPRGSGREEILLLLPGLALIILVSSQTGFNHHIRYILPALPFVFIWMSRAAEGVWAWRPRAWTLLTATALGWSVWSSLSVYPHSMSHFNEWAGGPMNGSAHLVDSNIDWGQDLLFLKQWLGEHPEAEPIGLAYFGHLDPRVAGINFSLPPKGVTDSDGPTNFDPVASGPRPGWYAVSVTLLRGYPYAVPDGSGGVKSVGKGCYTYFLQFRPVATAGYSIFIYHLGPEECNRARERAGLPPLADEQR